MTRPPGHLQMYSKGKGSPHPQGPERRISLDRSRSAADLIPQLATFPYAHDPGRAQHIAQSMNEGKSKHMMYLDRISKRSPQSEKTALQHHRKPHCFARRSPTRPIARITLRERKQSFDALRDGKLGPTLRLYFEHIGPQLSILQDPFGQACQSSACQPYLHSRGYPSSKQRTVHTRRQS